MTSAFQPPLFGEGLDGPGLWNALVALSGELLPLGADGASLQFQESAAPEPQERCLAVALDGTPPPLAVVFRDFPFRAAFGVELDMADVAAQPDALRAALLEGLRSFVLSLLPADLKPRLSLVGEGTVADIAGPRDDLVWLALRLADPGGLHAGLLVGWPRAEILRHLGRTVTEGGPTAEALGQHFRLAVHITLGSITLSLGEVGRLEPGAVVVLAETGGEGLSMRVGDVVFGFVDIGEGWRCTGGRSLDRNRPRATIHQGAPTAMDENTADDHAAPAEGDASAAPAQKAFSIDDMTVAIDFDLGRSMVPLAMVAGWQPGQVIEVGAPALENGVAVTIRANGDVVGHGDLVRIDERIGVRITRFFLKS